MTKSELRLDVTDVAMHLRLYSMRIVTALYFIRIHDRKVVAPFLAYYPVFTLRTHKDVPEFIQETGLHTLLEYAYSLFRGWVSIAPLT